MTKTLYIDTLTDQASTSDSAFVTPVLSAVHGSPITLSVAFTSAGSVVESSIIDLAYSIQKQGLTPLSPPRAITQGYSVEGSGTSRRYVASVDFDNALIRQDFAAASSPVAYWLQIKWRKTGEVACRRSQRVAITIDVANELPNATQPSPLDELEDPDLYISNRAVRYDAVQTLTEEEKAQALDNLGLNNTLSYQPGVIAVNATQVPGVRTEETLQAALDAVIASSGLIDTIDIIGGTPEDSATATAATVSQIRITGKPFAGLDLSALILTKLVLTTDGVSVVVSSPHGAPLTIIAESYVTLQTLVCRGTERNTGSNADTEELLLSGPLYIEDGNLSGLDGTDSATAALRHGARGVNVTMTGPCYMRATLAGGTGEDGTASHVNGGNAGFPGEYTLSAQAVLDLAPNGNIPGDPGVAYSGGTDGTSGGGALTTGTAHPSATFTQE